MNHKYAIVLFLITSLALVVAGAGAARAARPVAGPFTETALLQSADGGSALHIPMLTDVGDPVDFGDALASAAEYLKAMQADVTDDNAGNGTDGVDETPDDPDDGGWDWVVTSPPAPFHHTTAASPTNIYGETALGLYCAYIETGDASYFTALTDCANQTKSTRQDYRTGSDIIFLILYNDLAGVSGTEYADSAKAKFDRMLNLYGAAGWAEYIRDVRAGQGYENGIIAWDVGIWARAAALLAVKYPSNPYDYASGADSIAEVLWEDSFNDNPGYFDVVDDAGWDPTYSDLDYYWYTLGLCGLIDAFDAAGVHTSEISGLVTRLLDSQYTSGAISYCYGANEDDEDWQSTAYAAMTLGRLDKATYQAEINMMSYYLAATQDASGGWKYSTNNHYPEVAGEIAGGIYYATDEIPNGIAVDPTTVRCLNASHPCDTVDVKFSRLDTTPVRGYSVTFEISSELELCDSNIWASIRQGPYLSGVSATHYEVADMGGGVYTVDCAILGLPCGATGDGVLFTIDIEGSGGDGTGTVTVTSVTVRDCSNGPVVAFPGAPVDVTIDHTSPVAVGDLAATQVKSGNDGDGTTKITLTFTAPLDADEVEVYRAPYGDYPEYDDGTGAEPSSPVGYPPSSPWTLTSVTGTGQTDEPSTRDFWYYVVYTKDACGNVSTASNKTTGTLNYHLGDVTDGTTPGVGDNQVNSVDISLLGANYWSTLIYNDPVNYLDVGPTTDYSVDARPTTDNQIQFEDLMMFAINFGQVTLLAQSTPQVMERPEVELAVEEDAGVVTARVRLRGNRESVKGLHVAVSYGEGLEFMGLTRGSVWLGQGGPVFFEHRAGVKVVEVDGAVMGAGATLHGSGEVCEMRFRVVGESGVARLAEADLRDRANRRLELRAVPKRYDGDKVVESAELRHLELGIRPNPSCGSTEIAYGLPSGGHVKVKIYDAGGRLVRTLVDEETTAGRHRVIWDVKGVSPGLYMAILEVGRERETRKVTLLP
jgi:hypothetical protein